MNIGQVKKVLAASALALATLTPVAASAYQGWGPPPRAIHNYGYVYYPRHQIYYAPWQRCYYWQDRGRWISGPYLPRAYAGFAVGGVNISLDVNRPWERHAYVVERYGYRPPPVVYRETVRYYDNRRYYDRDHRRDRDHDHDWNHDRDRDDWRDGRR